jgi:hypothetical protein
MKGGMKGEKKCSEKGGEKGQQTCQACMSEVPASFATS